MQRQKTSWQIYSEYYLLNFIKIFQVKDMTKVFGLTFFLNTVYVLI